MLTLRRPLFLRGSRMRATPWTCSCQTSRSTLRMMAEVVLIGAAAYAVVALVHLWRIRRVGLAEAMKVQE